MDPIFSEETRNACFPILYPSINNLLQKQRGCFWQTHEISLTKDIEDWKTLNDDEQNFIKMVLAFFASSDLIVNKNLAERFTADIKKIEIQSMYHFQESMEDIHSEMYAMLIDTYISEANEKNRLFNAEIGRAHV